ncbi:sugar ABC transporter substrate-binding protein [filamentous cyanobacterium CCP5]|nr:sugar ABC transporter substrate-binding protein [filamentous cyanobacterium CCP5]
MNASEVNTPLVETSQPETTAVALDQAEMPTIALVMKTLTNPFFVDMEQGARQAEQELDIQLLVKTAAQETSIEQQISIIEDLIQTPVAAIVVAPGDSVQLIPVLKRAQDAGIEIINIDNRLNPERSQAIGLEPVPFISVDNKYGAYLAAKYVSDQVQSPTDAVILEGISTAQNAIDRKQGAIQAFSENANINLVASATANWKIDEAYTVIQTMFARHPDIGLIFAANDMMALGAIQYLTETGRDQVLVAGFDALKEAQEALRTGQLSVTIDQQAAQQGYLGVHYAYQALEGNELPAETKIDVLVVD